MRKRYLSARCGEKGFRDVQEEDNAEETDLLWKMKVVRYGWNVKVGREAKGKQEPTEP